MSDAPEDGVAEGPAEDVAGNASETPGEASGEGDVSESIETLREQVEAEYDFEEFTPEDMASMEPEEWEAVFDPDTWITGAELLDRLEADLTRRIAQRDLFAVVERLDTERVLAYSDTGYVIVHASGRVEGEGSILREVEPIVALCAMESYEVEAPPAGRALPDPSEIEETSGRIGHLLLQAVAGALLLGGIALLASPLFLSLPGSSSVLLTTTAGLGFLVIGLLLFVLVANARLSGRFRAQEYRERLDAAGVGREGRPEFVPIDDDNDGTEP